MLDYILGTLPLPKKTCKKILKDGDRCSNKIKFGRYCHLHRPLHAKIFRVIVFLIMGLISLLLVFEGLQSLYDNNRESVNYECDPYQTGCSFLLSSADEHVRIYDREPNGSYKLYWRPIIVNDKNTFGDTFLKDLGNKKVYSQFPSEHSPYELAYWNNQILLRGVLEDFKYDKMLGWFNEDQFKIDRWMDGGCAYTFCKDHYGVEIYNVSYEVIFSFTQKNDLGYRFAGSYRYGDTYYVNNGNDNYSFKDKSKATQFRSKLNHVFDFKSRDENGFCKRILYPNL